MLQPASAACKEDYAEDEDHADEAEDIRPGMARDPQLRSAIPDEAGAECANSGESDHPDEDPLEERCGTLPVHLGHAARSGVKRLVYAAGEMVGEVFEDDVEFAFELALPDHGDEEGGEAVGVASECGGEAAPVLDIRADLVNDLAQQRVIGLFFESVEDVEDVDLCVHEA